MDETLYLCASVRAVDVKTRLLLRQNVINKKMGVYEVVT